jgi:hypothetical protein
MKYEPKRTTVCKLSRVRQLFVHPGILKNTSHEQVNILRVSESEEERERAEHDVAGAVRQFQVPVLGYVFLQIVEISHTHTHRGKHLQADR